MKISEMYPPTIEICLCSRCASVYYEDRDYVIERADLYQVELDECDLCRRPRGYDFLIWKLSSLRSKKSHD